VTQLGRPPETAEWLDVARRCEYATFFHTPIWSELVTRTFSDLRDATRHAALRDGVRVVFPLVEVARRVGGRLAIAHSTAFGCYGGLIADGPVDQHARDRIHRHALRSGIVELELTQNPFAPFPASRFRAADAREDFTDVLSLAEGSSSVAGRFTSERRREIKKGRESGVGTRIASTLDDYRSYFAAYQDSLRRWGEGVTLRYPWKLFEVCHDLAQQYPAHVKLWLAEREGETLGGALNFYWNEHVAGWHSAVYAHAFDSYAFAILVADAVEEACDQGFTWFDLNPSGGLEGVAAFKSRFGGERRAVERLRYQSRLVRQVARARGESHA
jgi:Acetyltransferase (GNAT) domain